VGCGGSANVAACLRAVPAQTLIDNGGKVLDPMGGGTIGPIVNGTTLPESPAPAIAKGHVHDIRLMIGVARDEFNGGTYDPSVVANTPDQYRALVRLQYGPLTPTIMRLYPLSRFPDESPFIAYRTVMADAVNVCPEQLANRQLARQVPLYVFENDNADTPRLDASLPLGAFHNAENPFLFPNPALAMSANQRAFGDQIVAQWAGFARTGDPTVPGAPRWPRYTTAHQRVMSLVPAGDSAMTPAKLIERQHNCAFWDAVNANAPWQPRPASR
jgi:para-nitrobenzyl esterase